MTTYSELIRALESEDRAAVGRGLKLLQTHPELIPQAEQRYLPLIRARLNREDATIWDFEQAALTTEEVDFLLRKNWEESLTFEHLDSAQSKLIVDVLGAVMAIFVDMQQLKATAFRWKDWDALIGALMVDDEGDLFGDVSLSYRDMKARTPQSTWYSALIRSVIGDSGMLGSMTLNHTDFSAANESLLMDHFLLAVSFMSRMIDDYFWMDIAQSDPPRWTSALWFMTQPIKLSLLDTTIELPPTPLSFETEIYVRDGDDEPYRKRQSAFPTDAHDRWAEDVPALKLLLEEANIKLDGLPGAPQPVQEQALVAMIESGIEIAVHFALEWMAAHPTLQDFATQRYQAFATSSGIDYSRITYLLNGGAWSLDAATLDNIQRVPKRLAQRITNITLKGDALSALIASGSADILQHATTLTVAESAVERFPAILTDLPNLEVLWWSYASLKQIDADLSGLSNLREVHLSDNQLETFPEALFTLARIEVLDLSENQITTLPDQFCALTRLKDIFMDCNPLERLPGATLLLEMTHLECLSVSGTSLDEDALDELEGVAPFSLEY